MSYETSLPFERGSTFYAGASSEISNTDPASLALEGKIFKAPDTKHGTGLTVSLRVVRNGTGSAITSAVGVGYEFLAGKVLREVESVADAGDFGRIIDDAYPAGTSIPDDDLFYVVEAGPVDGLSDASYSAGAALAFAASGEQTAAAEGDYVIGIADEAATAGAENRRIIVGGTDATIAA